jgi:hypothetical protein
MAQLRWRATGMSGPSRYVLRTINDHAAFSAENRDNALLLSTWRGGRVFRQVGRHARSAAMKATALILAGILVFSLLDNLSDDHPQLDLICRRVPSLDFGFAGGMLFQKIIKPRGDNPTGDARTVLDEEVVKNRGRCGVPRTQEHLDTTGFRVAQLACQIAVGCPYPDVGHSRTIPKNTSDFAYCAALRITRDFADERLRDTLTASHEINP